MTEHVSATIGATPLIKLERLSEEIGATVYVKFEVSNPGGFDQRSCCDEYD